MINSSQRPFAAATNKFAYAQAFSGQDSRRHVEHTPLLRRLAVRRSRSRSV